VNYKDIQIIGFGPASLGLIVAADREKCLKDIACRLHFIESRSKKDVENGLGLNYVINSNSPGEEFLEKISREGVFADLFSLNSARRLIREGQKCVPLTVVTEFLTNLSNKSINILEQLGNSDPCTFGRQVKLIKRNLDTTYTSYCNDYKEIATSKHVVLANGAAQDISTCMTILNKYNIQSEKKQYFYTSDEILNSKTSPVILSKINNSKGNVVVSIVGGSHSAFSTAYLLYEQLSRAQINIVHRGEIKVYEKYRGEHRLGGIQPDFDKDDESNSVNRFSGLRDRAKSFYLAIKNREVEVNLYNINESGKSHLANADYVIFATGYKTLQIPIYDATTNKYLHGRNEITSYINTACQLVGRNGEIVPNIYGLGLGYPRATQAGVARVGINLFHGDDSRQIVLRLMKDKISAYKDSNLAFA